jgi:hypothetical protein
MKVDETPATEREQRGQSYGYRKTSLNVLLPSSIISKDYCAIDRRIVA